MFDINLPSHDVTSFFSGLIKTISWLVGKGCLYMNRRIDFVKKVGYFLSARGKKRNSNRTPTLLLESHITLYITSASALSISATLADGQ